MEKVKDARARYVMLKAIETKDDVAGCSTFAVVAPPNRVVVDKAAFHDQISRKIREQVEARSLQEARQGVILVLLLVC